MIEEVGRLLNLNDDQVWWLKVGLYVLAAAIVLWAIQRVAMYLRSLRPARLNPNLARYAGDNDPSAQLRKQMASRIRSTSSTDQIPGYKIIQAIDALYVEGFRTPAEALEGLKALAAEKGASAVINVRHERSSMGRCAASGDAVVAETTGQVYTPPTKPIEIEMPESAIPPKKKEPGKGPDGPMIR
jgi:uncharacterized protein YbjQ (UPF0145 family)